MSASGWGMAADFAGKLYDNWSADNRQEDAQHFNSAEALANRDWQERMSNTAVQRHKADLLAAGFNPLMAIGPGQGASTPGGSFGGGAGIASPGSSHSFAGAAASASQVNVNDAQARKLDAETKEVEARTPRHEWDIEEVKARIPVHQEQVKQMGQQIAQSAVEIERIWAEVTRTTSSAKNLDQQTHNLKAVLPKIQEEIQNLRALTAQSSAATSEIKQRVKANLPEMERILKNLERVKMEMEQPGHRNNEAAADSFTGLLGAYIQKINPLRGLFR